MYNTGAGHTQDTADCSCYKLFLTMYGLQAVGQKTRKDLAPTQIDRMVMGEVLGKLKTDILLKVPHG